MILIIAEDENESMSQLLLEELKTRDIDAVWIDQKTLPVDHNITFSFRKGKMEGEISFFNEYNVDLNKFVGIYSRISMSKPKIQLEKDQLDFMEYERSIAINTWLEHTEAIVVNPLKAQRSNASKLYQTWIVQKYGFKTPESLITNDLKAAKDFIDKHKESGVIYKSASSERSKVSKLHEVNIEDLEKLKYCPVLFQKFVPGTDLRVHTLVTGEIFASEINSESDDYRYDKERNIFATEIPDKIKENCINVTKDLGLYLSGIDIRRGDDGNYYCFEVNPSPAFGWYENQTEQPISKAVVDMMINGKEIVKSGIVKRKF